MNEKVLAEIIEKLENEALYKKRKRNEKLVEHFTSEKESPNDKLEVFLKEAVDEVFEERFEKFKNNELTESE